MPAQYDLWKSDTLDHVFIALAMSPLLSEKVIYKGARVLRLRLGEDIRASFDIDATFAANIPAEQEAPEALRTLAHEACIRYFDRQDPVRFVLRNSQIGLRRKIGPHPRGWDVYQLDLEIDDLSAAVQSSDHGPLRIDIAAPERLSERSVAPLEVGSGRVQAITLERIAGEKLRAFLSCLPTYREKIQETLFVPRRVKDLYDLARISRPRPISDTAFWAPAAKEFVLACESRSVDCPSIEAFQEDWGVTRDTFIKDPNLPKDVPFDEAASVLEEVARFLLDEGTIPLEFELPDVK